MRTDFDFIVVGGGSAGYAAARTAASLGLQTAVVEGGVEVGGLCILRGCMPSKTLLASANAYRTLRRAKEFGLRAEGIGFDVDAIRDRKEKLISEFAEFRKKQLRDGRFAFFRGTASFSGQRNLHVRLREGGSVELRGRAFLISSGSIINTPDVPGLGAPEILTSDDLLATAEVPSSVVVLGAGPVALEAAHYYESLGSVVTIVQRSPHFLSGTDHDIADAVEHAFRNRDMQIFTATKLRSVEKDGRLMVVRFEHGDGEKSVAAEAVMNAMGRRPAVDGLDLASAGVELDGRAIRVAPTQQTTTPHIFAAGDVCGPYEIVHIAIQQGEIAARNAARLLSGEGEPMEKTDYRLKVFAAFTEPQLAVAGFQEAELNAAGRGFLAATHCFADHGKSMVMGETEGFVKMLADPQTGELLGASVVGPEASDLIHETVIALNYRATVHEFAKIPHYHPTLSEIWTYPAEELAEKCGTASIIRS
jgi:pyruvate/2-oxoglutarate dehydrogenase complex dihydrolipoamide dehydrogenase (E3) component